MKILYVAKHNSGDNDDEGGIVYALRQLGHEVLTLQEKAGSAAPQWAVSHKVDACLFHKWETMPHIRALSAVAPCFFWYFDLVANQDDPTLAARMTQRRRWFKDVAPYCRAGFVTDGDWVEQWNEAPGRTGCRLHWLTQGMDERVAGPGDPDQCNLEVPEVIFTGMIHHGRRRAEHVKHLQDRYGRRFGVFGDGGPRFRLHGRKLADLFAKAKIVVAPDGPCTDRYWSNRVYLTTGLGGFLLHPRCKRLACQYGADELAVYSDREELTRLIDRYLDNHTSRENLRAKGYEATMTRHTYRHRCGVLVKVMEAAL